MRRLPLLALLAAPHVATAQLDADRPGLAMGTFVLDRGQVQIEAGLPDALVYRWNGRTSFEAAVPVMLRAGVGRGVEVRTMATPLSFDEDGGVRLSVEDVELSAKVRLTGGDGPARLSAVSSLFVPTDRREGWSGGLLLAAEADLSDAWTLVASAGIETDLDDAVVPLAFSLDYALAPRTHAYGEIGATSVSGQASGSSPPVVGVGLTQALSERVQGDVYVQRVLGREVWNVGAGLAVRF